MAVIIVDRLTLNPGAVSLPISVAARQTLRTNSGATETALFEYQLPDGFDVWFSEGGENSRVAKRSHEVGAAPTVVDDQLQVVKGSGSAVDVVEVLLSICDPDCRVRDIGMLQILR